MLLEIPILCIGKHHFQGEVIYEGMSVGTGRLFCRMDLSEYDGDFTDLSYCRRIVLLQNLKKLKRYIRGYMTVLVGSEFLGSRQGTFCSRVSPNIPS